MFFCVGFFLGRPTTTTHLLLFMQKKGHTLQYSIQNDIYKKANQIVFQ